MVQYWTRIWFFKCQSEFNRGTARNNKGVVPNENVSFAPSAHEAWQLASEVYMCYNYYNVHCSQLTARSVTTLSATLALLAGSHQPGLMAAVYLLHHHDCTSVCWSVEWTAAFLCIHYCVSQLVQPAFVLTAVSEHINEILSAMGAEMVTLPHCSAPLNFICIKIKFWINTKLFLTSSIKNLILNGSYSVRFKVFSSSFFYRFDQVGIYVVMFLEILQTLIKVLVVFSILIIAFGLAFYILLSRVSS